MNNSFRTRFAPSPTGYLHIGGARTALFNYLFAKANGGKFLLRVEDTDAARSTNAAIDAILQGLDWLGLKHDESYVLQSKNLARHAAVAHELLEKGKAYKCYTSTDELEEMRKEAEKNGEVFRFKSPWRNKKADESYANKPYVVRIKAPIDGEVVINDLVQGEVRVSGKELDDLVMLRSDGTPTYMLAVVVDDCDMGITHVIRGDDHFTNAFRQKIIYEAMGRSVPQFAHIPLIHGADGSKMSKRHGATSVIEYKQMGYLPEAMRNYLLRLGWSHGDEEIISDTQAIEWFGLDKIGKSPARFDFAKLDYLNKYYISKKSPDELLDLLFKTKNGNWHEAIENTTQSAKKRIRQAIEMFQKKGIPNLSATDLDNLSAKIEPYRDLRFPLCKNEDVLNNRFLLENLLNNFESLNDWSHDAIKDNINNFLTNFTLKLPEVGKIMRLVLLNDKNRNDPIFEMIKIFGKEETIARIKNALGHNI